MQLLAFVLSSLAFVTAVQSAQPQLCCPKTARTEPFPREKQTQRNLKGASVDQEGNLVCAYEGLGADNAQNPFCSYTPIKRQSEFRYRGVSGTEIHQPGEVWQTKGMECDKKSPAKGPGVGPCTSNICCPPVVFGKLQKAVYETHYNRETVRCTYENGSSCEYYTDNAATTFTHYYGACPESADTDRACVINNE